MLSNMTIHGFAKIGQTLTQLQCKYFSLQAAKNSIDCCFYGRPNCLKTITKRRDFTNVMIGKDVSDPEGNRAIHICHKGIEYSGKNTFNQTLIILARI